MTGASFSGGSPLHLLLIPPDRHVLKPIALGRHALDVEGQLGSIEGVGQGVDLAHQAPAAVEREVDDIDGAVALPGPQRRVGQALGLHA